MKIYIYETESIAFEGGAVEIVIQIAKDRETADQQMLKDPDCWVSDLDHLNNVYKVEEKQFIEGTVFRAKVIERIDHHEYNF